MTFIRENWDKKAFDELEAFFNENADEKYRKFQSSLCKTSKAPIIGVRSPVIKTAAKEILRGNAFDFLKNARYATFEEIMLIGIVSAGLKIPFADKEEYIARFIPHIDNWAVCDSFCAAIKPKKDELPQVFDFCMTYVYSDSEYQIRCATVMMMDYLICEQYIDALYEVFEKTDCGFYYTSMAVAWSVSFCFIKFPGKTSDFLKRASLDKDTNNRAIQKIIDSYRVSEENKSAVRALRRR